MNGGTPCREPVPGLLCQRYEQLRARVLQRTAMGISDTMLRLGMRSWMEAGCEAEMTEGAPAAMLPPDESFRHMVTVWASVLVAQAERSYREPRSV